MRFSFSFKPSIFVRLFLYLTVCLLLSQPAAAAINEQGRQKLEQIFSGLLQQYKDAAESNNATLETEGDILVEPSEFYYAVTLPHLTLRRANGAYTEIGILAINVMPGGSEGTWKMTIAVPTPIVYYNKQGGPETKIEMGSQNFAGIWNEQFHNFTRINAKYQDIAIERPREQTHIFIPEATLTTALSADANNLWSGPSNVKISGLRVKSGKDGSGVQIGEITMNSSVTGYDPEALVNYEEQLDALHENAEEGDTSVSNEHVLGLYNMIFSFLGTGLDGFGFDLALKDLSVTKPATEALPARSVKLDSAGFGFGLKGFGSGAVDARLQAGFDGFALTPQKDDAAQAAPSHLNFDLQITGLPYKDLVDLGKETLALSMEDKPGAAKAAGMRFVGMVWALLTKAHTTVALKDTAIGNDRYEVTTDGTFTADLKAVRGVTGTMQTSITGLENLVGSLQEAAADPDRSEAEKAKIRQTLSVLTIVQMAGQMKQGEDGKNVRVYNLSIDKDGKAMLNGTDLQTLLQGIPGPANKPSPG